MSNSQGRGGPQNQIPRVGEILGPGVDWLRANRPLAAQFVDSGGRYKDLFVGWGAQARLALTILTDEVASARLFLAKNEALTELARSQFESDRIPGAVAAVGSILLERPNFYGGVNRIVMSAGGSGYTSAPTVTCSNGATAVATIGGGGPLAALALTSSGSGYSSAPTVAITGGGGTGAAAYAAISGGGAVTGLVLTALGSGYTSPPSVTITGGGGTGAGAVAVTNGNSVLAIAVTSPGAPIGVSGAVTVTITGGGGSGAQAYATPIAPTEPGGSIPKGFRFRVAGQPSAIPPVPAMTYETTRDVPVNINQGVSSGGVALVVPVVAQQPGAAGNAPVFQQNTGVQGGAASTQSLPVAIDAYFDPTFYVSAYEAAGGLDGESDDDLRAQASAYVQGQFGPTLGAIVAGALRGTGAHRVVVRDYCKYDNTGNPCAITGVCVADDSWSGGIQPGPIPQDDPAPLMQTWVQSVAQSIADEFQGFGGVILVTGPTNLLIYVTSSITLRDANFLNFTEEISANVQGTVQSYFDDRADWYTFTLAGLRAAIARADHRILTCTSAGVYSVADGSVVAEPPSTPQFIQYVAPTRSNQAITYYQSGMACTHFMLAPAGLTPTYSAPT